MNIRQYASLYPIEDPVIAERVFNKFPISRLSPQQFAYLPFYIQQFYLRRAKDISDHTLLVYVARSGSLKCWRYLCRTRAVTREDRTAALKLAAKAGVVEIGLLCIIDDQPFFDMKTLTFVNEQEIELYATTIAEDVGHYGRLCTLFTHFKVLPSELQTQFFTQLLMKITRAVPETEVMSLDTWEETHPELGRTVKIFVDIAPTPELLTYALRIVPACHLIGKLETEIALSHFTETHGVSQQVIVQDYVYGRDLEFRGVIWNNLPSEPAPARHSKLVTLNDLKRESRIQDFGAAHLMSPALKKLRCNPVHTYRHGN